MKGPIEVRFASYVEPEPNTGCHLFVGYCHRKGYGRIRLNGRMVLAHRYAYEKANGQIPAGLVLDHRCRTRCCVNVNHLRVVTPRQNALENSVGIAAKEAAQTHCKRGHEFTQANTYRQRGKSSRWCRACRSVNVNP